MRFKIGDKVRVRPDLVIGKRYGNATVTSEMKKFEDKEAEVVRTSKGGTLCYLKFKGKNLKYGYIWSAEMLTKNMLFLIDTDMEKSVRVLIGNNKYGEARCHPDDEFDLMTGIKIAFARAKGKYIPCKGQEYFIPHLTNDIEGDYLKLKWYGDEDDMECLKKGLVFHTPVEAQNMANKMLRFAYEEYTKG